MGIRLVDTVIAMVIVMISCDAQRPVAAPAPAASAGLPVRCYMLPDPGMSFGGGGGGTPMWFFNETSSRCHQFRFRGFGGNKNRFWSRQQCNSKCTCRLPPAEGICMEIEALEGPGGAMAMNQAQQQIPMEQVRYFHRAEMCHPFTYMGCGGNGNNFKTRGACLATCPPEPTNPMDLDFEMPPMGSMGAMAAMGAMGPGSFGPMGPMGFMEPGSMNFPSF